MSIGIDIGKFKIKIVELSQNNDTISVVKADTFPTFDNLAKFDLEKINASQIEACIQDLCKKMNINPKKSKNIVTSLPGGIVDVRQIKTLDMPDQELSVSLELEAKKHIPTDGTDAIIDYHHLGADSNELDKINLLLVATTKNIIKDHSNLIKNSGFKPGIFDTVPIALANAYSFNYELPEEGADVILDIGNSTTNIIVWGKNLSFFTRTLETAGNSFNQSLMQANNTDYESAEKIKLEKGVNCFDEKTESDSEDFGISLEKKTIFNELTDEIRKTLRYYMKNNNQAFFNTFYLTGGSSKLEGLSDFIAKNLNVKTDFLNPLNNLSNEMKLNENEFSVAIGLALRGLEE